MSNKKSLISFLKQTQLLKFEPESQRKRDFDTKSIKGFLQNYNKILVLTGAGVSTESGLPDYRSKDVGLYERSSYRPIQYSTFLKSRDARVRFWARNYMGWPKFSSVLPNTTHFRIASYQTVGNKILGIVTQNVDGLHSKAGSENVIELHGNSYWVQCLGCLNTIHRHDFQQILDKLNPHINETCHVLNPDGDVEISEEVIKSFNVPDCEHCGGILKPCVVFFGDNVPPGRVKKVEKLVEECDALLVLGTTLSTLSSYRIVSQASELCKFICIINIGPTRGDKLADLVINCKCSEILPKLMYN